MITSKGEIKALFFRKRYKVMNWFITYAFCARKLCSRSTPTLYIQPIIRSEHNPEIAQKVS